MLLFVARSRRRGTSAERKADVAETSFWPTGKTGRCMVRLSLF
jgi:hypothetical protein